MGGSRTIDPSVTDFQLTEFRPDLFEDGQELMTVCERGRTTGNVYNYEFWKCPCGYYPGEDDGPPPFRCYDCKRPCYTDDESQARAKIRVVNNGRLVYFKIVWQKATEA